MKFPNDEAAWLAGFTKSRQGTAADHLGITLAAINAEKIEMLMPITDKTRQPVGMLHGGISMALAETAAGVHATWDLDLDKYFPVGIEINGSHVRSASEGTVRAVGTVVRRSRTLIVEQVEIFHEETGKLLCSARVTCYFKPIKKKEE